jgi:hypothetical protein
MGLVEMRFDWKTISQWLRRSQQGRLRMGLIGLIAINRNEIRSKAPRFWRIFTIT